VVRNPACRINRKVSNTSRDARNPKRLGAVLWRFWHIRGYVSEGIAWLEQILASNDTALPERVKTLEGMGGLAQFQGDTAQAEAAYDEMRTLSREFDDKGNVATALNSFGTLALARGDNKRARALLEENLSVLQQLEEEGSAATPLKRFHALNLLAVLMINEKNDYGRATGLLQESLVLAQEVRDTERALQALCNLGYAALMQGDYERVTTLCGEA
jgi:tetratricopeptide (TPR) repeat protein